MTVVQMDLAEGLLVARTLAGTRFTAELMGRMTEAERRFAAAPEVAGRPKVRLIITDPGAPTPGPKEREQFSKMAIDPHTQRLLAYVSESVIARAAFGVISVLRGVTFAPQERAFATRGLAVDWFESRRPGVRGPLLALLAKVDEQIRRDQGISRVAPAPNEAGAHR